MNDKLKHNEVIIGRGYMDHVRKIVDNFIEVQSQKGIIITNGKYITELNKLCKLFIAKHKVGKPVIINSDLGFGKSTLLAEFIKYMCNFDDKFGAIIVKKTIKECKDFVIELGLKDKNTEDGMVYWDVIGNDKDRFQILKDYYNRSPKNENDFIARAVRSFNKVECKRDVKILDEEEYSHNFCGGCKITNCPVKLSLYNMAKHRILVITHQRLFLSNDHEEIIKDISYWKDGDGNKYKREDVYIDEKLQTVDINSFSLNKWNNIHADISISKIEAKQKKIIESVNKYITGLSGKFPSDTSTVTTINEIYDKDFIFDNVIYGLFIEKPQMIEILNNVEKFLRYGGTLNIDWRNSNKIINYKKYIRLDSYFNDTNKCIVLDATSPYDKDYDKSDVVFVKDLKTIKKYKMDIYESVGGKTAKSSLYYNGNEDSKKEDNVRYYQKNIDLIARDIVAVIQKEKKKRTLIVCYKSFPDIVGNTYHFKKDLQSKLDEFKLEYDYSLAHFGENTTGINDYADCEVAIIIGQLNKGNIYYTNKSLVLNNSKEFNEIKANEYTIDMIQQIGRTAIRRDNKVNVYMLGVEEGSLINNLAKFFNAKVKKWALQHYNEFNIKYDTKQDTPKHVAFGYIIDNLKNINDTIEKKVVKNYVIQSTGIGEDRINKIFQDVNFKEILESYGITTHENIREFKRIAKNEQNGKCHLSRVI